MHQCNHLRPRNGIISATNAYRASNDLLVRALADAAPEVAVELEELRLARARLEQRRIATAQPRPHDRSLLRHVMACADAGTPVTPSQLADLAGSSRPRTSIALGRLADQGLVRLEPHPADGRRRVVLPVARDAYHDGDDDLAEQIHEVAARMTSDEAAILVSFIRQVRRIVDDAEQTPTAS